MPLQEMTDFELRFCHADAQGFGFIGAGDDAAVIVGQHDYRLAYEVGPEKALAACIEVIAVNERP